MVLEATKSKIKVPAGFGFWWDLSSWLGDSYFVLMFPFLQERREEREREREKEISSFYKATNPIGLGPHPMPSFNLSYLLKALFPNVVTLGVRTSALVGDTVQSIAVSVLCLGIQLPVCRAAAQWLSLVLLVHLEESALPRLSISPASPSSMRLEHAGPVQRLSL